MGRPLTKRKAAVHILFVYGGLAYIIRSSSRFAMASSMA